MRNLAATTTEENFVATVEKQIDEAMKSRQFFVLLAVRKPDGKNSVMWNRLDEAPDVLPYVDAGYEVLDDTDGKLLPVIADLFLLDG